MKSNMMQIPTLTAEQISQLAPIRSDWTFGKLRALKNGLSPKQAQFLRRLLFCDPVDFDEMREELGHRAAPELEQFVRGLDETLRKMSINPREVYYIELSAGRRWPGKVVFLRSELLWRMRGD